MDQAAKGDMKQQRRQLPRTQTTGTRRRAARPARRGNAMILAAAILVLLAIVTAAFLTRTQSGRATASAVQKSYTAHTRVDLLGEMVSREVSEPLFVQPIDRRYLPPTFTSTSPTPSANIPRVSPEQSEALLGGQFGLRYGYDAAPPGFGGYALAFNFAPYATVPETNWPDGSGPFTAANPWPWGPAAPTGTRVVFGTTIPIAEGNPAGNPGHGDSRWLRDTEPLRWDTGGDGFQDAFKYWRHMTNIARPNNGWRIIRDLSDVTDADGDGLGGLVLDLDIPVEQWLVSVQPDPSQFDTSTGDALVDGTTVGRWQQWLADDLTFHGQIYANSSVIPPNFYDLKNLDGDGVIGPGEVPSADFVGPMGPGSQWPSGTPRWNVGRFLADADGDGFTDSFWFLAPTPVSDGVRQAVAISIVDDSALLDVNVATRFDPVSTRGETPADLALVGQGLSSNTVPVPPNWSVGYLDAAANHFRQYVNRPAGVPPLYGEGQVPNQVLWDPQLWDEFLGTIGVAGRPQDFPDELITARDRRIYWLFGGSRPLDATFGLTPFSLGDELELRMYHGQNYSKMFTRFERAFEEMDLSQFYPDATDVAYSFFRADRYFRESNPMLGPVFDPNNPSQPISPGAARLPGQLNNPELLYDNRRKVTLFSGARNDLLPPWLRWRWERDPLVPGRTDVPELVRRDAQNDPTDADGNGEPDAIDRFFRQALTKVDLREPAAEYDRTDGTRWLHERLPWVLVNALADGDQTGGRWYDPDPTASGNYDAGSVSEVRRLAAALAANIEAWRDPDDIATLEDEFVPYSVNIPGQIGQDDGSRAFLHPGAVPLPEWGSVPADPQTRYLGMERQPFLMEAFVAHVYEAWEIPDPALPTGERWDNSGDKIVVQQDDQGISLETTITVVQLANPYDKPINLVDDRFWYEVEVFGQPVNLRDIATALEITELPPAREDRPATMILYSIENTSSHFGADFKNKWIDFLDLEASDHPRQDDPNPGDPGTILVDLQRVAQMGLATAWSTDRGHYDDSADDEGIELVRVTFDPATQNPTSAQLDRVVIDRFDDPDLSENDLDKFAGRVRKLGESSNRPPTRLELENVGIPTPTLFPPHPQHPTLGWDFPPTATGNHWAQWARVTRAWGNDFTVNGNPDPSTPFISPRERNPRYVYARKQITTASDDDALDPQVFSGAGSEPGHVFNLAAEPDDGGVPWFAIPYQRRENGVDLAAAQRKPTFFDMNHAEDPTMVPPVWTYPDKGFYHSEYPLQMLQKDGDFQQVGELLNVWLYGHELRFNNMGYEATEKTFSESMADFEQDLTGGDLPFINRLHLGHVIGNRETGLLDVNHFVPDLPAAFRVLDSFVCDGPGQLADFDGDGVVGDANDLQLWQERWFGNAQGFSGRGTPGLINPNTAPIEVLRALPHWYKLVHVDPAWDGSMTRRFPRTSVAEAAVSYREMLNYELIPSDLDYFVPRFDGMIQPGADYSRREAVMPELRRERGFASIGELLLLDREPQVAAAPAAGPLGDEFTIHGSSWRIDFAALDPFQLQEPSPTAPHRYGAFLSTDVNGYNADSFEGDRVAGDSEERNLLFSGASNLLTTHSDVFTVYLRVRTFREKPVGVRTGGSLGPVWDATDRDYILDDSRYVMLVDRSEVERPGQAPKILYFDKLPN